MASTDSLLDIHEVAVRARVEVRARVDELRERAAEVAAASGEAELAITMSKCDGSSRSGPADVELAEAPIVQHLPERVPAPGEDLLPVRDEQHGSMPCARTRA